MTRFARIGTRPRASRTDDLGSPHIPGIPRHLWLLEPRRDLPCRAPAGLAPAAADLRSHVAMR